jgi:predicted transcriptional regulator
MKTDLISQVKSLFDKVKAVECNYKEPLIFINGCYAIEVLKNPMYRRYEGEVLQYFLEFFYKDMEVVDKYILGNNCIGWLSYGEAVSKDLIRVYNNLSFTGVIFELSQDNYINWKEELKNFDFDEDEIEVIVNLLNKSLTARELLQLTDISQTKLYLVLNDLEQEGIIKSVGGKPKLYYIDNIKEILQKRHEKIERENMIKRMKREKLLRKL